MEQNCLWYNYYYCSKFHLVIINYIKNHYTLHSVYSVWFYFLLKYLINLFFLKFDKDDKFNYFLNANFEV